MEISAKIKKISAREILDSRGNPTVECKIIMSNGETVHASVPSGASVGKYEAVELRDGDKNRYQGLGVYSVIENIEKKIAPILVGKKADVQMCDKEMRALDGTHNKSILGANAILPVSIAIARAQALTNGVSLSDLLGSFTSEKKNNFPCPMFNILNGGVHATNNIMFQEFMVMPLLKTSFSERLRIGALIYHRLKKLLVGLGYSANVGDEGGFAPRLKTSLNTIDQSPEQEALDLLLQAVELAGFKPGTDVAFCLDVAASQFFLKDEYKYALNEEKLSSELLVERYKDLSYKYPIYSIEDGLDEEDWSGWKSMTDSIGEKVMLVGDDIFVSNSERIHRGILEGVANAVLIKPNQIGSVTETIESIDMARKNNYKIVISHRSGETCDAFIADLAVGVGAEFFKAGAPARGERVAKYNRLLELE